MKISIFGTNQLVERLVREFIKERDEIHLYYREQDGFTPVFDVDPIQRISYKYYEEVEGFLENFIDQDAILLLSSRDEENFLLARLFSRLEKPIHMLVHDSDTASFLQENPWVFQHASIYSPGLSIAEAMQKHFYQDRGMTTEVFNEFQLSLLRYPVENQAEFVDRRVKNIGAFEDLVVVGVRRGNEVIIPNGNTILRRNDRIHLLANPNAIRRFKRRHHIYYENVPMDRKKFFIYGTNDVALSVGKGLLEKGADLTFIGQEEIPRRDWAEKFPDGNYFSFGKKGMRDGLKSLSSKDVSGFIACSDSDGDNALACIAAYDLGIKNTTIFVEDESMVPALDTECIQTAYTGSFILSNQIKRSLVGPKDLSLHLLPVSMEVYEVLLKESSFANNKTLEQLDLPKGFLVGGIIRTGESNIIPKGNTRLKAGDRLLIFLIPEVSYDIRKFLVTEPKGNLITELLNLY
ncbi:hypothetical protein LQU94_07585 [Peptoniphilus sp. KCTC 25270]|uniref:TrkA C-terminal domain-containing protein n=1 Tax=Peptoniphilus sp. KCTC 25270 TaxID=2897414 RepID=UPI001E3C498A|nr:TrkA C-terminal domain-containing protein [Peptoniphilus sp. KCTC 25270]MCD1147973.1 hypothetical protein [Peptoniphilus sp. KCTC 25270]